MAGSRQRARQRKAMEAKASIINANVQALKGGVARIGRVSQVNSSVAGLSAATHLGTFRDPLHNGGSVKVIAHVGYSLGRPETGRMFGKVAPPFENSRAPRGKPATSFAMDGYNDGPRKPSDRVWVKRGKGRFTKA